MWLAPQVPDIDLMLCLTGKLVATGGWTFVLLT
jgi:hypothetical protein